MWAFEEYKAQQLENSEFAKVWEDGESEFQIQRALIKARLDAGLSQRDLSKVSGVPQKTISLIESGGNTTFSTLGKLARALGKVVTVRFEDPVSTSKGLTAQ